MENLANTRLPVSDGSQRRVKYLICGLSRRAIASYIYPLLGIKAKRNTEDFSACGEIVGIFDIDRERVETVCATHALELPFYDAARGLDEAIERALPDALIVAGPDDTHHQHILAGLRYGLRVIAEKPVVINCKQMQAVLEAEKVSRGSLIVTHNYRYVPINSQLKRLVQSGRLGQITNVEFVYNLDTFHGPSYFERWNRSRSRSGGLTIHKSVHHLDLINWLVGSSPETVFACGALNYFGPHGFHKQIPPGGGEASPGWERDHCPYFKRHREIHSSAHSLPGRLPYGSQYPRDTYIYDREIDIEDTYSAVIKYASGVSMSFSCNFSTPWEGYQLAINGSLGRVEASYRTVPDDTGHERPTRRADSLVFMPLFGGREELPIARVAGGHGGSDPLLQRDLFVGPGAESRALGLPASAREAALAIAAGEAIWRSARDGCVYYPRELLGEWQGVAFQQQMEEKA